MNMVLGEQRKETSGSVIRGVGKEERQKSGQGLEGHWQVQQLRRVEADSGDRCSEVRRRRQTSEDQRQLIQDWMTRWGQGRLVTS